MAEKKIVHVEAEEKKENKKINIDLSELKKIGAAIVSFVASNPALVSKLLEKPAAYLKKIVNGEDVSKNTKTKVNKTIDENKSGGITSILTSLSNLSGGDKDVSNIFGNLSKSLGGNDKSLGDVTSLLSGVSSLLGDNSSKKSKKASSNSGLGSILKGLFK